MTRELFAIFPIRARGLDGGVDYISDYSSMIGICLSSPHLLSESKGFFNCWHASDRVSCRKLQCLFASEII